MIASLFFLLAQAVTITEEGTFVCSATKLNFVGSSATATCPAGVGTLTFTDTNTGHVIADEGGALTQRATLDFAGAGVTCADSGGTKTLCTIAGGGGGAPTTATYHTQTPDATLSAEQAWSLLGNGLVLNTTGTGVASIYAGHTCAASNWLRVLSASGAGTCSQPLFSDLSGSATDAQVPDTITINSALDLNCTDCIGPVEITDLTLTTDTAGNYVASHATGLGLSGGAAGSEGAALTTSLDYGQTLAGNPALAAKACIFTTEGTSGGGFVCEGTIANTNEQLWLFPALDGVDTTTFIPLGDSAGVALTSLALNANPADCAANQFATTIAASGALTCAALVDADVPNTITVDLATLATTATTANAGDSATAFFPAGLLEVARGGTGSAPALDDQVLVSDSAVAATWRSVPDCGETGTLNYTAATNSFSCLTDAGAGAAYATVEDEGVALAQRSTINFVGTSISCADAAGPKTTCTLTSGGGNAATTSVAVTSAGMFYTISAIAATWVATTSRIVCSPHGGGASTPTAESIAVSGIDAIPTNLVAGVSFDLMVRNPYGLEGTVEFRCVGV